MRLEQICAPVRKELQTVDRLVKKHLDSDNGFIRQLNEYVINKPGKRLRPALVLLSAKTAGPELDKAIAVAAAVEIIHTATLIHDDVVDGSDKRRGQPTVNSKWSNGISIVLGDSWYSRAIAILAGPGFSEILEMLLETVDRMCAGELEHLKRCYDLSFNEQEYLEIVEKKTAGLMSFCCKAAALTGNASAKDSQALVNYGLNFGIAFQIIDDCMDMVGTERRTGKPSGSDLSAGKVTLPIIHAINSADKKDKCRLRKLFESRQIDKTDADRIKNIVIQSGAVEFSLKKAAEYCRMSKSALKSLKDCESRRALSLLADHIVERGLRFCQS